MNLFKRLDLEYRKSCLELSRATIGTPEYYVTKKREESLELVLRVLQSMSWVKREETKKKVTFFMENRYDYSKLANEFSMSKESSYVMISRANREFEKVVGINCVEEILQDRFDIENLAINTNNISQILIDEIKDLVKPKESKCVSLLECMQEIVALKNFSRLFVLERFNMLDLEKLEHVLYILESDFMEYVYQKEVIKGYINGEMKMKDAEEKLKYN